MTHRAEDAAVKRATLNDMKSALAIGSIFGAGGVSRSQS